MSPCHPARGEVPYLHRMQLPVGMATSVKNANQRHTSDQWVQWLTHPTSQPVVVHTQHPLQSGHSCPRLSFSRNLDIPLPPNIT